MAFKMKYGKSSTFDYGNGSHLKQVAPTYKKNKDGEVVEITKNGGKKQRKKAENTDDGGLDEATTPAKNQGKDPVEPLSTRIANNELTQKERDAIRLAEIKIIRERLNKGK